ncbi:MAG: FHA domain-containing protein [Anaerolineae bacterium]|nr:FHA domain-containing protein [Anaerolineae bacterium]
MQLVTQDGDIYELNNSNMSIGRSSGNDIQLPEARISKRHALLYEKGDTYILVDQHSTNGTFVNGQRITAPYSLKIGDVVSIGSMDLEVVSGSARPTSASKPVSPQPEKSPVWQPESVVQGGARNSLGIYEIGIGLLSSAMFLLPWLSIKSSMFGTLSAQRTVYVTGLVEAGACWPVILGYLLAWSTYAMARYVDKAPQWLKLILVLSSLGVYGFFVAVFGAGLTFTPVGTFGLDTNSGGSIAIREGAVLALVGTLLIFWGVVSSAKAGTLSSIK